MLVGGVWFVKSSMWHKLNHWFDHLRVFVTQDVVICCSHTYAEIALANWENPLHLAAERS